MDMMMSPLLGTCNWLAKEVNSPQDGAVRRCACQARVGFQNVCLITLVMCAERIQDSLENIDSPSSVAYLLYCGALLAYYFWVWTVDQRRKRNGGWPSRSQKREEDEEDPLRVKVWILLQVLWGLQSQLYVSCFRFRASAAVALLFVRVPWGIFLGLLLPVNMNSTYWQLQTSGHSASSALWKSLFQGAGLVAIHLLRARYEDTLHRAKLAAGRERMAVLHQQWRAESQRASFQGLLDSMFDASCVCDNLGNVVSSTPHMDALLLGPRAVGHVDSLCGLSLADFARGRLERERVQRFLSDVSGCSAARRIQLSLTRMSSKAGTIEVTMSGITMPATAGEDGIAGTTLFIGMQMAPEVSLEPDEDQDLDEAWHGTHGLDEVQKRAMRAHPLPVASPCAGSIRSGCSEWPAARQRAFSVSSSPPILEVVEDKRLCGGDGADCLPAEAVVRVEGKLGPCNLDSIELGSRVLCFDHLSGCLKYSEVVEIKVHEAPAPDMVMVGLEDGAELMMTADHPLLTQEHQGGNKLDCPIRAGDLKPGHHSLEVLKVAPVLVQSVRRVPQQAPTTRLVSLSVRQPHRHSVFVASGSGKGALHSVGVASASVGVMPEMLPLQLRLRKTFMDMPEEREEGLQPKSSSAPILALGGGDCAPCGAEGQPMPHDVSAVTSIYEHSSLSCGSSAATHFSSCTGEEVVIVGRGVEDRRVAGATSSSLMRLSALMDSKAKGLRSLGSLGHEGGWCYPCLMNCWQDAKPCRYGIGCSRCHEAHTKGDLKKVNRGRKRELAALAA